MKEFVLFGKSPSVLIEICRFPAVSLEDAVLKLGCTIRERGGGRKGPFTPHLRGATEAALVVAGMDTDRVVNDLPGPTSFEARRPLRIMAGGFKDIRMVRTSNAKPSSFSALHLGDDPGLGSQMLRTTPKVGDAVLGGRDLHRHRSGAGGIQRMGGKNGGKKRRGSSGRKRFN